MMKIQEHFSVETRLREQGLWDQMTFTGPSQPQAFWFFMTAKPCYLYFNVVTANLLSASLAQKLRILSSMGWQNLKQTIWNLKDKTSFLELLYLQQKVIFNSLSSNIYTLNTVLIYLDQKDWLSSLKIKTPSYIYFPNLHSTSTGK